MTNQSKDQIDSPTIVDQLCRLISKGISLIRRVITGKGMITITDQAVASATNFFTGIIIARACAKEQFGLYTLGFSIVVFVLGLQTSLISSPYTIYSPHISGQRKSQYAGSTLIHQLSFSSMAVIFLILGGVAISSGSGMDGLPMVVWVLAVVMPAIILKDYFRRFFFAELRMTSALLMDSFVSIFQFSGLMVILSLGILSASRAYWVIGIACALSSFVWFTLIRKDFTFKKSEVFSHLARNWSLGKWLVLTGIVFTAGMQVYPWLIAGFHGIAATSVFAACMGVTFIINPLLFGIKNFLGPRTAHTFAEGGSYELYLLVRNATIFLAAVMGAFCLFTLFFGDWLVGFLYGVKYEGNGFVVFILALMSLVSALGMPANSGLQAMERPDLSFKSSLISVLVMLTLGLWLVKSFSLVGAAFGLLASSTGGTAFQWIVFSRQVKYLPAQKRC